MKLKPIFEWWQNYINKVVEMRIGFRANEQRRAFNMIKKMNKNGLLCKNILLVNIKQTISGIQLNAKTCISFN